MGSPYEANDEIIPESLSHPMQHDSNHMGDGDIYDNSSSLNIISENEPIPVRV